MDRLATGQQDHPKIAVFHLLNCRPAAYAAIRLNMFPHGRRNDSFDPMIANQRAIRSHADRGEIGGDLYWRGLVASNRIKLTGGPVHGRSPAHGTPALSNGLGGFFFVCTQERIDSHLVARPLCVEPIDYVGLDSQGNDRLGRNRLETAPHDSAHDMLGRGLRLVNRQGDVAIPLGSDARPISFGFA